MLSSHIIMLKEILEAALIVGIVIGYLSKTNQTKNNYLIYLGNVPA